MTILSSIDSKSLASALDRAASGSDVQMASVQNAPFLANHHLMNFAVNLKSEFGATGKSAAKRPHSGDGSDQSLVIKHPRTSSNSSAPSPTSSSKPKIGFSIESIVGSRASPDIPANESGFHSVSPRPSSGTPLSVRSDQESIPDHPQSPPGSNHMFRADVAAAAAAGMMSAGWPQVPPPQMNPAYFEALAGMRNLYAQQQQQQQQQHHQAKLDGANVTNVCKVKPQQQAAMNALAAGQISSSPTFSGAPTCGNTSSTTATAVPGGLGTAGPIGYHQYSGMPAVPSPPMVFGSTTQQLPAQAGIYQPFLDNPQFSLLQVLNGPNQVRSQFSHFNISSLSPSMGPLSSLSSLNSAATGPFGQQNILFQQPPPPSPAAPPSGPGSSGPGAPGHVPPVAMNDLYQSSVSTQYRLQGHGPFGQSQHNTPGPLLISGNNSLGLKSSSYGSIGQSSYGSIGTKTGYQQQPSGHQHSQVYFPYDPSQQVLNLSQVNQMGGQSYLSNSQLLQQRTAPPPVQPPPSSYYSAGLAGAGGSSAQTGFYQPTGGPNLQQVPPSTPGPFALPGFASQAGLQGFANRNTQQQQQQPPSQQQLNQLNMGGCYRNGPNLGSQAPTGLSGLQFAKQSPSGTSPAPAPSPAQYLSGHMDALVSADVASKMDMQGHSTSPKTRNKVHHQQQQQLHQMNKFSAASHSSGAYPGPPSVIRAPGFASVRTGPPPQTSGNSSNMLGSAGNTPRYPTPIQRPTAATPTTSQNPPPMHPCGPPSAGLGMRPRAPNPHPARIPGTGSAPGQPSHIKSAVPVPTTISSAYGIANEKANSVSTNSNENLKGSSPTEAEAARAAPATASSDSVDKESAIKIEPVLTK